MAHVHIFEAGKPVGDRCVDYEVEVPQANLKIGGSPPCEVVVPGLPAGAVAEIRVVAHAADIVRTGAAPVMVAGRDVPSGQVAALGAEVLLTVGNTDLVFRMRGSAASTQSADGAKIQIEQPFAPKNLAEHPSAAAADMLKDVYAALGVPDENPALVVYDQDNKVVKRIDLAPPHEKVTIGRAPDCGLVLYHQSVSKNHAEVGRDGLGFYVKDTGSKNGTQLNGSRVSGMGRVKSGDRILVGAFTIRFVDPKKAVRELAESVPDLQKLDRAKPGEQVKVGGSGDLEATSNFEQSFIRKTGLNLNAPEEKKGGWLIYAVVCVAVLVLCGIVFVVVQTL